MENPFEIIIEKLNNIEKLLHEIANQNSSGISTHSPDDLMTVKSIAEYLSVSISTIYKLSFTMEIPHIKRGNRLYFKKEEINKWLSESRRKTRSELEAEANTYLLKKRKLTRL